jgi:hypothetical protein
MDPFRERRDGPVLTAGKYLVEVDAEGAGVAEWRGKSRPTASDTHTSFARTPRDRVGISPIRPRPTAPSVASNQQRHRGPRTLTKEGEGHGAQAVSHC